MWISTATGDAADSVEQSAGRWGELSSLHEQAEPMSTFSKILQTRAKAAQYDLGDHAKTQ